VLLVGLIMITPAKPRQSGIPAPGSTPGRTSGIPTPGRSRSSSTLAPSTSTPDNEYASKAFAEAIRAHDPALHRPSRVSDASTISLSPKTASYSQSGRRSVTGRPSSSASSSSGVGSSYGRTPAKSHFERSKTPNSARPASRQSDIYLRSASRTGRGFEVGDNVRIESLGFEGALRYIGDIEGKSNVTVDGKSYLWAGVELSGGFSGKGKNDGTVDG
jgi:CAP-Gly domain-containing linker protein 1